MLVRLCNAMGSVAIGVAVATAGTARAESCLDRVVGMGNRYDLATDLPTAGPRGPHVSAEDLARSGGAIEPRRLHDGTVIAPPAGKRYGMPTLPNVEGREPPDIDLAALQAVLVAARANRTRQ